MKRVYAREEWCVDCGRCEVACKTAHSKFRDTVKTYRFEGDSAWSRIHVEGGPMLSFAMSCRHCEHPRCVDGCISGALRKDPETGIVLVDEARCVGCGTCVSACPFGCIALHNAAGWQASFAAGAPAKDRAFKCDLCQIDGVPGEPACVAACPNRALVYEERGAAV